jgi:hypothetical protein
MYLVLFIVFFFICLVITGLWIARPDFTALGFAGFFFMFILSFVVMQGDIQYKVGMNETNTYECLDLCETGNTTAYLTHVEKVDVYETWDSGGFLSHWAGYILAVVAVIGIICVFVNMGTEGFLK